MITGTGYGAMNIAQPQEIAEQWAQAQQAQTQARQSQMNLQESQLLQPERIAAQQAAYQSNQMQSQAQTRGLKNAAILQAMSGTQDAEDWDQAMSALADQGVTEAQQYVGRYSEKNRQRWMAHYQAETSALSGGGGGGAGGAASGLAQAPDLDQTGQYDAQLAGKSPQEIAHIAVGTNAMLDAINAVDASSDPAAEWDRQAAKLGLSNHQPYSPERFRELKQHVVGLSNYLDARGVREQLGLPQPKPPAKLESVGGELYSVDASDPANPKASLLAEGKGMWQAYTGADGKTYLVNSKTGETKASDVALNGKVGGGGRGAGGSVYEDKKQSWLAVHPGDMQGALDYAGGRKSMTPQQLRAAAGARAEKDLTAIALAGGTVADPQAFLAGKTEEYYQQGLKDAATPAPKVAPDGAGGAGAPQSGGFTGAQKAYEAQFPENPKAKPGAQDRPFYVKSAAEVEAIRKRHPGAYVVGPSGTLKGPL